MWALTQVISVIFSVINTGIISFHHKTLFFHVALAIEWHLLSKADLVIWNQSKSIYLSSLETGIVMGTGFFVTMLVKPLLWHLGGDGGPTICEANFGPQRMDRVFPISPFRCPPTGDPNSSLKHPPSWGETSFHRWHPRHMPRKHPFWNGLIIQIKIQKKSKSKHRFRYRKNYRKQQELIKTQRLPGWKKDCPSLSPPSPFNLSLLWGLR